MAQISSRLCSLPELLSLPSHHIRASDCFLRSCRESRWNPAVVFSSAIPTERLTGANNGLVALCFACVPAVSSHVFQVGEQFNETRLVRITYGRFTIWLHPFGMLDSQIVMDLLPKLCVSVDLMSHGHSLG